MRSLYQWRKGNLIPVICAHFKNRMSTVHLESLDNKTIRRYQLSTIFPLLSSDDTANIWLSGKFNFRRVSLKLLKAILTFVQLPKRKNTTYQETTKTFGSNFVLKTLATQLESTFRNKFTSLPDTTECYIIQAVGSRNLSI